MTVSNITFRCKCGAEFTSTKPVYPTAVNQLHRAKWISRSSENGHKIERVCPKCQTNRSAPLTPTGADVLKTCLRQLEQAKKVIEPFAAIVIGTSGRIPTERLSAHDWHELIKFYEEL